MKGRCLLFMLYIDALKPTDKVLIVDDLIATGGTIQAIYNLVKQAKATVVGFAFVVSLSGLPGLKSLNEILFIYITL